ncbi:MAG: carboxypeptidase-like regulatory domain-containing protein [Cytophagales bacterium]|nr:carboxypeptidase-like regulatory domain-containing protein [Cytophagales bacterium]
MRKGIYCLIFAILASLCVYAKEGKTENSAKTTLEVIVVDAETDEPIPAVKIKIGEKEYEAYTDFDGLVKFNEVPQGSYDIEVSFISYEKRRLKAYQVNNTSNKLLIKLKP